MSKLQFKGNIVHTEKYQDKNTGEEKKKYTQAGALFQRNDGSFTVKMFDTWFNVYPPKAKQEQYSQVKENLQNNNFDDEIPF